MSLEEDYQKLSAAGKQREEEARNRNIDLGRELSALKEYKVQLADQLNTTKAVVSASGGRQCVKTVYLCSSCPLLLYFTCKHHQYELAAITNVLLIPCRRRRLYSGSDPPQNLTITFFR